MLEFHCCYSPLTDAIYNTQIIKKSHVFTVVYSRVIRPRKHAYLTIGTSLPWYGLSNMMYTSLCKHFRSIATIFDFHHIQTSDSILTSLSVLPRTGKTLVKDVDISFLSCIWVEIHVIYYMFPVSVHHLRFSTYPYVYSILTMVSLWWCLSGSAR